MNGERAGLDYACHIASQLGMPHPCQSETSEHPALGWRRSGLMDVTGRPAGPGLMCPVALTAAADGVMLLLNSLAGGGCALPRGSVLLGERARILNLTRNGRMSANGSCRLLDTADDRQIALNMARSDDWDILPAWLEGAPSATWNEIVLSVRATGSHDLVERGIELGLAIAASVPWLKPTLFDQNPSTPCRGGRPLVVDLSALWAGPLATSLLGMMGADVVKVESTKRLDGARLGNPHFYALMNGGKRSVTFDFDDPASVRRLRTLVDRADIVIEASRPRALARLGVNRTEQVARGAAWVSITAHEDTTRIGFGDDASVGGGLAARMKSGWGAPLFAGDAIADPITGLHAALAAWWLWANGGGFSHLSLAGTVAHVATWMTVTGDELAEWQYRAEADHSPLYPLRTPALEPASPGAHNMLLDELCLMP